MSSSSAEYCEALRRDASGKLSSELADRITTNHTFFNRESSHFDSIKERAPPEAIARNPQDEATSVVSGMPREAANNGGAEFVDPLHEVAGRVVRQLARRAA